jgi:8-oxo-dGTP pyrophosphatase MutT (NUDIX family)
MAEAELPDYCCALLADPRGWLWLQLRPPDARFAAAQLTCFGGRREPGEAPEGCLRRELDEELGWRPEEMAPCCELRRGREFIARFYRVTPSAPGTALRVEAGSCAIAAPWAALSGLPLSPWHAAVLAAVRRGQPRVVL